MTLTETLIQGGLLKQLKTPKQFYRTMFGNQFLSKTDTIVFDEVFEDASQISKFVAPNVVSKVNQTKSFDIKTFRPAYAKEKDVIEAWNDTLMSRIAGEAIGGQYTMAQRAKMVRAYQLSMHRSKMKNLQEYMCFKAFANGELEIKGEQYPVSTISYGRNSALTLSTLGATAWNSNNTFNPLSTIAQVSDLVYEHGNANVDTIIMGRTAFAALYSYMSHKDRQHLLDSNIRGSDLAMNLIAAGDVRGVDRVMSFTGLNGQRIEIYVDNRYYTDEYGVKHRYIADTQLVAFDSQEFKGVMAFGAIKDKEAGYLPMEMHHKEFTIDEPSADFLLTQSAPLPIVLTPNAVLSIADVTK